MPLYNSFNSAIGMEGPGLLGFLVNSTVIATKIASFQCPSDNSNTISFSALSAATGGAIPNLPYSPTKGNYGVNWGNTDYGQWTSNGRIPNRLSPVSVRSQPIGRIASGPTLVRVASVTDGLSNTQFVSELLQGAHDDLRGTIWVDNPGAGSYMTRFTPNGNQDILQSPWGVERQHATTTLTTWHRSAPQDWAPALRARARSATAMPVQQLACTNQGSEGKEFVGTRSRHPGGVNTLFGDGSVHFMKNSISPQTWVALGSIAGGEVISSDPY